jgi:hypothetical protein
MGCRYLDKEGKENELKQVVGETLASCDIGDGVLVLGTSGMLYCLGYDGIAQIEQVINHLVGSGFACSKHWYINAMVGPQVERILVCHLKLASLSVFVSAMIA